MGGKKTSRGKTTCTQRGQGYSVKRHPGHETSQNAASSDTKLVHDSSNDKLNVKNVGTTLSETCGQLTHTVLNYFTKIVKLDIISRKDTDAAKQPQNDTDSTKQAPKDLDSTHRSSKDTNTTMEDRDHVDRDDTGDTLFPRYFIWIVFTVTVTFRLWYVSSPSNWWVLHPDEIYQTMEVAHSEVYGYGFRPYEYLPPPETSTLNVTSALREGEIKKGMYSLRSFLLPKLLSLVMFAGRVIVPSMSPYLVTKLFHVVLTSALPVSVYAFSLALHGSRDIALLAAMFVSSSTTLNIFGTHTLSNSFIAPVLFYSLVPLIKILTSRTSQIENNHILKNMQPGCKQNGLITTGEGKRYSKPESRDEDGHQTSLRMNGHLNGCVHANGYKPLTNGHAPHMTDIQNGDVNGNIVQPSSKHNGLHTSYQNGTVHAYSNGYSNGNAGDKNYFLNGGHVKLRNGIVHLTNGRDKVRGPTKNKTANSFWPPTYNDMQNYILGLCLALCVYIRLDCAIIPTACMVALHPTFIFDLNKLINELKVYIMGFVTGILIGGLDDHVMYGRWFLSPLQWFRFNVWEDTSSKVFGSSPASFYLNRLLDLEPWVLVVFTVLVVYVTVNIRSSKYTSFVEFQNQNCAMAVVLAILFIFYSLSGHKEYRFLHNAIVLMYIAFSQACRYIIHIITRIIKNQNDSFRSYFTYLFVVSFVSSHIYQFIDVKDANLSKWSYGKSVTSHEVNVCLDFVRKQNDVSGVYVDYDIYMFGGLSIIHKNVPVMALNKYDIIEYSMADRVHLEQPVFSKSSRPKSLALFLRISEFISIFNTPYLLKHLIRHWEYNYIVLPVDREFIDIGYRKVFSYGNTVVLRRTFVQKHERTMWEKAEAIPIGSNATVMEYEGYWLQRFGQYSKAERRLLISNRLGPRRLGPFQLLRDLFRAKKNETVNVNNVIKACLEVHSRKDCHGPYVPVTLGPGAA